MGYATLVIDSVRGRRIGKVRSGQEHINIASVLYDGYRGLDVLAEDPRIDDSRRRPWVVDSWLDLLAHPADIMPPGGTRRSAR
jgi:hypothetical protein